ncbi:class I SAM-dependent methyltransferase [Roseovarius aestuariivivens]|uniref:class I SAM-dependent methyltransferase n=1 Tax=Roseovarius aestuariivivens TaxID=1888910 RepID=UPI00107FFF05|nr:class I SAM-dependent methyltransferase [Roseovarius aestuariivivens]
MGTPATFWNKRAKAYAASAVGDADAYEATLTRVRAHLSPEDRVLELGCGTGTTALRLADAVAQIDAWDYAEEMIAIAEGKPEAADAPVAFHTGGIEAAVATGPYDVVMAFNLLHLLDDLDTALADIHGAVRPGGLFISKTFCAPERGGPLLYRVIRLALPVLQLLGLAPKVVFHRVAELDAAIGRAGFEIVETGNYPEAPPRRFVVARRPG